MAERLGSKDTSQNPHGQIKPIFHLADNELKVNELLDQFKVKLKLLQVGGVLILLLGLHRMDYL